MQNFKTLIKVRSNVLVLSLVFLMALLTLRAAYLTIGNANRLQSNLAIMNRSPQSFIALGKQIDELQYMTTNIDNYKLGEIKSALTSTARLAGYATTEYQAQYDSWQAIQGEITKDRSSFTRLKQQLDEVQKLQDVEIVRLKRLLDESANPSFFANSFNLFLSFIVGILSSILASHIYERLKAKQKLRTNKNELKGSCSNHKSKGSA